MLLKGHSLYLHSCPLKLSHVSELSERLEKAAEATWCPSTHIRHVCPSSCVSIVGSCKICSCMLQTYCHLSTNKNLKSPLLVFADSFCVIVFFFINGVINYGSGCRRGESVALSSPEYSPLKAKLSTIEHGHQTDR